MWLVDTQTCELHDFSLKRIPPYAILSHTWAEEEVSFRDMSSSRRFKLKGYTKIKQTCRLALRRELNYAWIDTCCIDKSSSAELTESINSMFRYYSNAAVCFVALQDLQAHETFEERLPKCRWITRGWTLQELLAPAKVEFYDAVWKLRGSKHEFVFPLSKATRIAHGALMDRSSVRSHSIATRMSWAAHRRTTRIEDMAYSLLGIFDVNMPLIYGEGHKAFRRLQEEIIKHSHDLTILAWDPPQHELQKILGVFATSPLAFAKSSMILPFSREFVSFSISNIGLKMAGNKEVARAEIKPQQGKDLWMVEQTYLLKVGRVTVGNQSRVGIYLRKIGPNLYYRKGILPLAGMTTGNEVIQVSKRVDGREDYHILTDPDGQSLEKLHRAFRTRAIRPPIGRNVQVIDIVPDKLWDIEDCITLKPHPDSQARYRMAIAMRLLVWLPSDDVQLLVLCRYDGFGNDEPTFLIFEDTDEQCKVLQSLLFKGIHRWNSINWATLEMNAPSLGPLEHTSIVQLLLQGKKYSIRVSAEQTWSVHGYSFWQLQLEAFYGHEVGKNGTQINLDAPVGPLGNSTV